MMQKPNKHVVLFDCGETLVRLNPPKERIVANFLRERGTDVRTKDIKVAFRIVDFSLKQSVAFQKNPRLKRDYLIKYNMELFKALGLSQSCERWTAMLFERFRIYKKWSLFSDTVSSLDILKHSNFTLGIIANWDNTLLHLLEKLRIRPYFNLILSSMEVQTEKPDPEIFYRALDRLQVAANDTFYVGNEYETDVIGARKAGIEPILIDRRGTLPYADCLKFPNLAKMVVYVLDRQPEIPCS